MNQHKLVTETNGSTKAPLPGFVTGTSSHGQGSSNRFFCQASVFALICGDLLKIMKEQTDLQALSYELQSKTVALEGASANATAQSTKASGYKQADATMYQGFGEICSSGITIGVAAYGTYTALTPSQETTNLEAQKAELEKYSDHFAAVDELPDAADIEAANDGGLPPQDAANAALRPAVGNGLPASPKSVELTDELKKKIEAAKGTSAYEDLRKAVIADRQAVDRSLEHQEYLRDRRDQARLQLSQAVGGLAKGGFDTGASAAQRAQAEDSANKEIGQYVMGAFGQASQTEAKQEENYGAGITQAMSVLQALVQVNTAA